MNGPCPTSLTKRQRACMSVSHKLHEYAVSRKAISWPHEKHERDFFACTRSKMCGY